MPSTWLLKTEPDTYSYEDLARERKTTWDGVSNPVALKHLRAMKKGDQAFIYHTGGEKAVVGIAEITGSPYPDPGAKDARLVVVDLKPVQKLERPVSLAEIKSDKYFAGFDLVRISRLSVMPVPPLLWRRILRISEGRA